jgi:hypothetical protein
LSREKKNHLTKTGSDPVSNWRKPAANERTHYHETTRARRAFHQPTEKQTCKKPRSGPISVEENRQRTDELRATLRKESRSTCRGAVPLKRSHIHRSIEPPGSDRPWWQGGGAARMYCTWRTADRR